MASRKQKAWTDKTLYGLKPENGTYEQGFIGMRGLHVRVFPNGKKAVRFQYIDDGKRYRMVLGHFPAMTASELRARYLQARADRSQGINLVEEIERKRAESDAQRIQDEHRQQLEDNRLDFNVLADLYMNQYAKSNKKSWKEDERILNRDILPVFGTRKVDDVKRAEFTTFLSKIAVDAPVMANRVLACIRAMLNWGVNAGYVEVQYSLIFLP